MYMNPIMGVGGAYIVLEIGEGENVVDTSEATGKKCPNIGKF